MKPHLTRTLYEVYNCLVWSGQRPSPSVLKKLRARGFVGDGPTIAGHVIELPPEQALQLPAKAREVYNLLLQGETHSTITDLLGLRPDTCWNRFRILIKRGAYVTGSTRPCPILPLPSGAAVSLAEEATHFILTPLRTEICRLATGRQVSTMMDSGTADNNARLEIRGFASRALIFEMIVTLYDAEIWIMNSPAKSGQSPLIQWPEGKFMQEYELCYPNCVDQILDFLRPTILMADPAY